MPSIEQSAKRFWEQRADLAAEAPVRAVLLAPVCEEEALILDALEKQQLSPWLPQPAAGTLLRALDLGCGAGRWTRELARRGVEVTGVDAIASLLAAARRGLEADGFLARATLLQGDLSTGELPAELSGAFDLIYIGGVLMYLEDDTVRRLAAALVARLRPGGRLLLREAVRATARREEQSRVEGVSYAVIYRDRAAYPALFTAAGWRLQKRADVSGFPVVDLIERALSGLGVAYGNTDRFLSPRSPLWGRFVRRVTPRVVAGWPRLDRAAAAAHRALGDPGYQATHQIYWFEPA